MFNFINKGTFAESAQDCVGLLLWQKVNHLEKMITSGHLGRVAGGGEEVEEGVWAPGGVGFVALGVQGTTGLSVPKRTTGMESGKFESWLLSLSFGLHSLFCLQPNRNPCTGWIPDSQDGLGWKGS